MARCFGSLKVSPPEVRKARGVVPSHLVALEPIHTAEDSDPELVHTRKAKLAFAELGELYSSSNLNNNIVAMVA